MGTIRPVCIIVLLALMTACASTPQVTPQATATQAMAAQQAQLDAERAAKRVQEEKLLAEQKARAGAAQAEAARAAAAEEQARRETAAKQPPVARKQQSAGNAGARPANQNTEKRAQEIAKQQKQIADLRVMIAANKSETAKLDGANKSLKQAIAAAESLSATLSAEQQKYSATDPATGKTQAPLAKSKIEELTAEVEKLRAQAAALTKDSK